MSTPIFCCFIFFEECLNLQVRNNKMVKKHNYHTSPSEFTSRIHPLIFLWTPKVFISPEYFLIFFSPWLQKSFKFMTLRLPENALVSQKTESVYFYSCSQKLSFRFLSPPLQAEENYPFHQSFWKIYFFPAVRGRTIILKI